MYHEIVFLNFIYTITWFFNLSCTMRLFFFNLICTMRLFFFLSWFVASDSFLVWCVPWNCFFYLINAMSFYLKYKLYHEIAFFHLIYSMKLFFYLFDLYHEILLCFIWFVPWDCFFVSLISTMRLFFLFDLHHEIVFCLFD